MGVDTNTKRTTTPTLTADLADNTAPDKFRWLLRQIHLIGVGVDAHFYAK